MVDGVTSETGNQGGQYVQLAQDWVQEFSVLNAMFPWNMVRSAGGVINTVLRSGGNQFHGRAYAFYQNAVLNADPRFYTGTSKAPFVSDRIGGMVGGPIKKDKLFFFGGFERFPKQLRRSPSVTTTTGAICAYGSAHRHSKEFTCTLAEFWELRQTTEYRTPVIAGQPPSWGYLRLITLPTQKILSAFAANLSTT